MLFYFDCFYAKYHYQTLCDSKFSNNILINKSTNNV